MIEPKNTKWEDQVVSVEEALAYIKPGMTIFLGSGVAEPRTLMKALIDSGAPNTNDLELIQLTSHSDVFSLKKPRLAKIPSQNLLFHLDYDRSRRCGQRRFDPGSYLPDPAYHQIQTHTHRCGLHSNHPSG